MSYTRGSIYQINCKLDKNFSYIGSTFNGVRHRWSQHKTQYALWLNGSKNKCSCYDYFKLYGIENFFIVKIKDYICYRENDRDYKHLHAYEQLWINKTKNCCNKYSSFNPLSQLKLKVKKNDIENRNIHFFLNEFINEEIKQTKKELLISSNHLFLRFKTWLLSSNINCNINLIQFSIRLTNLKLYGITKKHKRTGNFVKIDLLKYKQEN